MTQNEQELIVKAIDGVIYFCVAYIARVGLKIVENVSSIPKMKSDIDGLYKWKRSLDSKDPNG